MVGGLDKNDKRYILGLLKERKFKIESEIEQLMHINDDDELTSELCVADHKTELLQVGELILKMDEENYLKAV